MSNPGFDLTRFGPRATFDKTRPSGLILQVKPKNVRWGNGELMADDWVAVREHVMNPSLVFMDGAIVSLLTLEAELRAQGIPTAFDPSRPGGYAMCTRAVAQPFRLLVPSKELQRAMEIAANLESEIGDAEAEASLPLPTADLPEADDRRRSIVRRRFLAGFMLAVLLLMWIMVGRMG